MKGLVNRCGASGELLLLLALWSVLACAAGAALYQAGEGERTNAAIASGKYRPCTLWECWKQ